MRLVTSGLIRALLASLLPHLCGFPEGGNAGLFIHVSPASDAAPNGHNEHLSTLMNESFKAWACGDLSENPVREPLTV